MSGFGNCFFLFMNILYKPLRDPALLSERDHRVLAIHFAELIFWDHPMSERDSEKPKEQLIELLEGRNVMVAERSIEGILIDPEIPDGFWSTPKGKRPPSHLAFWNTPFILTVPHVYSPRYDVYCLDGGAWEHPTCWGKFATLEEAVQCARSGNGLPLERWKMVGDGWIAAGA